MKIRLAKPEKQNRIPPLNLEELKGDNAVQFAAEVSNKFSVLEALREEKVTGRSLEEHQRSPAGGGK